MTWEKDKTGLLILELENDWIYVVDTDAKRNNGFHVYLLENIDDVDFARPLTTHGHVRHATRMCERHLRTGEWKKYTHEDCVLTQHT